MKLPDDWKADIEDHGKSWSLLAFPLVEHPAADVQYRVAISANKYTESQYLRMIRNYSISNTVDWSGSEHLQTSLMTNAFWIYCRRDIYGTNGFSYSCMGRIKRGAKLQPKDIHRLAEEEDKLATEVRRILDSIESVSTNSAIKP